MLIPTKSSHQQINDIPTGRHDSLNKNSSQAQFTDAKVFMAQTNQQNNQ